ADPRRAPPQRLPEADLVRVPVQDEEIDEQEEQHAAGEGRVQPPVLGEWEEGGHRRHAPPFAVAGRCPPSPEAEAPPHRRRVARSGDGMTSTAQLAWSTTRSWI